MLISHFITRIRPLGTGLSFPFYFDSSYLLGSSVTVEKYIFIGSVCAAFTHDCPALRAALRKRQRQLCRAIGPSALLLGAKGRCDETQPFNTLLIPSPHFVFIPLNRRSHGASVLCGRRQHEYWCRSAELTHARATRRGNDGAFGAARDTCTPLNSAYLSIFGRPH